MIATSRHGDLLGDDVYRMAVEAADTGVWRYDVPADTFRFNATWAALFGYAPDELGRDLAMWSGLAHPDDLPRVMDAWRRLVSGEDRLARFEHRMRAADGEWRWFASRARVVERDADGAPLVVIGTQVDVTLQKQAELALGHSRGLMAYVVENMNSAVAIHDRDLRYIYCSQRYLDDYDVEERDVIGKHHYDVFPDLPQKWRDMHQRVLAGESLAGDDDPYLREDGTTTWTRWKCLPWYADDGGIGGIIVYTEVIDEQKRREYELIAQREQLRRLARRLADASDKEQARLAVELHDTVLSALAAAKIRAQLASSEAAQGDGGENLESIVALIDESIRSIRQVVTDLVPAAMVSGGLPAAVEWLARRYQELHGLQVSLGLGIGDEVLPDDVALMAYRLVREGLNNIVRHARVDAAAVSIERIGPCLLTRVEDEGDGFDPAAVTFDVDGGYGLFSLHEQCRSRGGVLAIDSEPGGGTRLVARMCVEPCSVARRMQGGGLRAGDGTVLPACERCVTCEALDEAASA